MTEIQTKTVRDGDKEAVSLEKLQEFYEEIKQAPKIDTIIVSPEVYEQHISLLPKLERDPTPMEYLSGIHVYIHWALGQVIIYGNSKNELIQKILATCERPKKREEKNV